MDSEDTDSGLELDGFASAGAVNDELPIPDGEQDAALEHMRAYVERERAALEMRREATPDPEFVEYEREFRELMAERLAEELGVAEEYDKLRERRATAAVDAETDPDGPESSNGDEQ